MEDPLKELEDWVGGAKGRYVREICISTGYDASCWGVTLGNTDMKLQEDWVCADMKRNSANAEVYAAEVSFFEYNGPQRPNVVIVASDDMEDWPGLGATIMAAIKRAKELGL